MNTATQEQPKEYRERCRFSQPIGPEDRTPWVAWIPFSSGDLVPFAAVADCIGAPSYRRLAADLVDAAGAIARIARLRGENDDDPAGTLDKSLAGVEFLLNWSSALSEIADCGHYGKGTP